MQNKKTSFKIRLKRIGAGFAVSGFVAVILAGFLMPPPAYAFENNDALPKSEQQDRTILYAIRACLAIVQLQNLRGAEALNDMNIYGGKEAGNDGNGESANFEIAVGHELIADDGTAKCSSLSHARGLRFIGMTEQQYRNALYEPNTPHANFKLKPDARENMMRLLEQKSEPRRQSAGDATGPKEKNRRVIVAFLRCYQLIPDGAVAPGDAIEINGKKYKLKSGKSNDDKISVGHDLQEDGTYECHTLADLAKIAYRDTPQAELDAIIAEASASEAAAKTPPGSNPDCDTADGGPLQWIICPIIDLGANFTDGVFRNFVRPLLEDIPIGNDPSDGGYRAWQGFRALGNIMLAGCLLAIVYAQARGDK